MGLKSKEVFKMEKEKIKKINIGYLLGYIFIPIIVCAICFTLSGLFFQKGTMAVILLMGPSLLSVLWWSFAGSFIYKKKRKEFEKQLDDKNFKRDHTFYGKGSTVIVDVNQGKIGLICFWNPFENFVLPAKRIDKVWVDDGKCGAGFMAGSSRVSFLFTVDTVKVRVNTFTSNQRFRMDSDYILTAISKADMMVQVIEEAKGNSK